MRATIDYPLGVLAAANLSNAGYCVSFMEIRREGDRARVSGTNGFAAVSALVPARFNRWPDGKAQALSREVVRNMMTGVGKSIRRASNVSFDFGGGKLTVSTDADGSGYSAVLDWHRGTLPGPYGMLPDNLPWNGDVPTGDDGKFWPSPRHLKLAAQSIETLGLGKACDIELPQNGTVRITASSELVEAVAFTGMRDGRPPLRPQ